MTKHDKGPNIAWTLLGWINFVAIALFILVLTGARPTAWQILGGMVLFIGVSIFLVWAAFRRR